MSYLSYKEILLEILKAIDYKDDKDAFVQEFTDLVQIQAIEKLITALPQDQQEDLKSELAANKDYSEKVSEILRGRFPAEQMQKSLEETMQKSVTEWMQAVNPTLNDVQRQKLLDLSQELNPTPPPAPAV